ncbi:MAG: PQQ-binding-like beta-propeller repeat protein [Thermoplasmata archaeon]
MTRKSFIVAYLAALLVVLQLPYATDRSSTYSETLPFESIDGPETPLPTDTTIYPWPMHLYDPLHRSFTPAPAPDTSDVLWWNTTGSITYGSPAIAGGMVFIGAGTVSGDYMFAFYQNNGTLAWQTKTVLRVNQGQGLSSSPAYANGYLVFGGDRIYCLYASNGTIKWTVNTGNLNWGDGTPTIAEGKVFIGGSDRKVYAIDLGTGTVLWTFQTLSSGGANYGLYAAPAVWNGYVYVAACDGWLYQILIDQPGPVATEENKFFTGYAMYGSPVIFEGKVYVGNGYYSFTSPNNRFFSLNATDLSLVWEFYPGAPTSFFSSAAIAYDMVFVGSVEGNLYALDSRGNGGSTNVIWQYPIGQTWSSPAIASGQVFIGSRSNYLYAFDAVQTGSPQYNWIYNTGGDVDSSPAVSDGKIYVGTHGGGGRIYCFGSPSDFEPPFGLTWSPTASNVPVDTDFAVVWSESMDWGSVENSFSYTDGFTIWFASAGVFTHQTNTNTSIFNPTTDLDFSTTYWVTFSTTAKDVFGNPLDQDQDGMGGELGEDELVFSFTTTNRPGKPEITSAVLEGPGLNDVRISWNRSSDDGIGDDDVVQYLVYSSSQYDGLYSIVDSVVAMDLAQYSWSCIGCGHGDSNDYFYYVTASDGLVESVPSNRAAKFVNHMLAGKNLISIPLVQHDETLLTVLQTIGFDLVWRYEAFDVSDRWKTFSPSKRYSDLDRVDHKMALWVDVTMEDDLTIAGLIPSETEINLKAGWNFVGFPSFDSSFRIIDLKAEVGANRVEGFEPLVSPYFLTILSDGDTLQPGSGYWVKVESDTTWSIRNA